MFGLPLEISILLILCIIAVMAFEFINGFHDTANAVATVIYTNSLKPTHAVIWSGIWNFIGVNVGGIAVAMGIVNLLPTEVLVDQNMAHSISMILALVLTAIIWNLGTWYWGIPCSSSHTLIGSIFGVGIAYMLIPGNHDIALNWNKVKDIGLSLLISPVFGFGLALLLMMLLKKTVKNKKIFDEPSKKKAPPMWIRAILVLTCTSVSFSHGSNDGQKGVGLFMLILIGIVPAYFAINTNSSPQKLMSDVQSVEKYIDKIDLKTVSYVKQSTLGVIRHQIDTMKVVLTNTPTFKHLKDKRTFELRKDIILVCKETDNILKTEFGEPKINLTAKEKEDLKSSLKNLKDYTEYAPKWVILLISLSLGLGTMVGWKRIVVTIGEKIGKSHLTYSQGASAEIIAASTIGVSTWLGLPVSTTHVLSSGVAGAMVSGKGLKNLRKGTVRSIAIAWVITLPVTIVLSGGLFLLFRWIWA